MTFFRLDDTPLLVLLCRFGVLPRIDEPALPLTLCLCALKILFLYCANLNSNASKYEEEVTVLVVTVVGVLFSSLVSRFINDEGRSTVVPAFVAVSVVVVVVGVSVMVS